MRDFEAAAVSRTRREVGWGSYPSATRSQLELVRRAAEVRGCERASIPGGSGRPLSCPGCGDAKDLRALGEVLDAARRMATSCLGRREMSDPMEYHLAAMILDRGYPVDHALDYDALVARAAAAHGCQDSIETIHLRVRPGASLRLMHPDHAPALIMHLVRCIAEVAAARETQFGSLPARAPKGWPMGGRRWDAPLERPRKPMTLKRFW